MSYEGVKILSECLRFIVVSCPKLIFPSNNT